MSLFADLKTGLLQKALSMVDIEEVKQKFVTEGSDAVATYLESKGLSPEMTEHLINMVKTAAAESTQQAAVS